MSFLHIYQMYGLRLRRGQLVEVDGRAGRITKATNKVYIKFVGEQYPKPYHPKDESINYNPEMKI